MIVLLAIGDVLQAEIPKLTALFPSGGQAGSEITVSATGTKTIPEIWTDSPHLEIVPDEKNQFQVKIAENAPAGPCLIRLFNEEGASPAKTFVIGSRDEISEDKNDLLREPQVLEKLPILINAKLEKNDDVDFYRFTAKKGQTIVAKIDCYSLGSLADPFLHLLDPIGREIAFGSVSHNLDPVLVHQFERDGEFLIQVAAIGHKAASNVNFAGGEAVTYRLDLAFDEPLPAFDFPKPTIRESADTPKLDIPSRIQGRLAKSGEIDRFTFTAEKGDKLFLQVDAHKRHTPVDAVMRVIRPDERDYKVIDDLKTNLDPELLMTAPLDGDYVVEIKDRFSRGGPRFEYQLLIEPPKLDFRATGTKDQISIKAGEETTFKIKLERLNGHKNPLTVSILGLPEGLELAEPKIPEKTGDLELKLTATPTCAAWQGAIRIRISETGGADPQIRDAFFTFQASESRGDYLLNETSNFWLTVLTKAKENPPNNPKKSDSES